MRRPRVRVRRIGSLSLNRMIPNILTLLALCAGMTSMRFALDRSVDPSFASLTRLRR